MATTVIRRECRTGIVFPIATLSLVGVAGALSAIGDDGLMLLYRVVAFISTLNIGGGLSPGAAGSTRFVPFLVGVVSLPTLRIFARDAMLSAAAAGGAADRAVVRLQSAAGQDVDLGVARIRSNLKPQTVRNAPGDYVFRNPGTTSKCEPSLGAKPVRMAAFLRTVKLCILMTLSLGLWWGICAAAHSIVSRLL